ncbi:MAG: quinone-dependent dihydroorotate dehydrogenase [Anaerolineae bacterium]
MSATYPLVRAMLFRLDAEMAHNLVLGLVRWAGLFPPARALLRALYTLEDARLEVEAFGVRFRNPVGLAAGYDKNGSAVRGLSALGFGHIEVGTVTLHRQAGNPRPRIHRIPQAQALINSMGFPNAGVEALRIHSGVTRIGINIGKSRDTPLTEAAEDYCALLRRVHGRADYVALNVSSPNTPELRKLQTRAAMERLLQAVAAVRDSLQPRVPLLVKIAPDLSAAEVDDILAAMTLAGIDGVIATNTTLERGGIPERYRHLAGGLSGAPLRARATELVRYIARRTEGRLPIIGVGGICSAADALEKFDAGACLVQVYTGLVYAGPGLVRAINQALLERAG